MRIHTISSAFMALIMLIAAAKAADMPVGKAQANSIPSSSELKRTVLRFFQNQADYLPGDLIVRENVAPLFAQLQKQGFPLPDAKQILESMLSKNDFLAEQFATPAGTAFMRKIAKYPDGYDRADRLSRMIRGQSTLRELIRGPDGNKMIEYMTTAQGGKELGRMLGNAPYGEDFNRPTGRIYTADQLLERLEKSLAASKKKRN